MHTLFATGSGGDKWQSRLLGERNGYASECQQGLIRCTPRWRCAGRWIVNQTKSGPAITFETFRYEVEDWEELGPYTETSRWNLSPGMGFDGRKDHPMTENIRKCLKIQISEILVDNLMNVVWFGVKNRCIRLLPTRSTTCTPQNLSISI